MAFGLSWLFIGLLPVILACIARPSFRVNIEPHWLFFSTIGFCIIVAAVLLRIYGQVHRPLGVIVIVLLLLAYGSSTLRYNDLWRDEKRYCHYMSEISPQILSNYWLADVYKEEGKLSEAKHYYTKTISGYRRDWKTYTNLGVIENALGNPEEAKRFYFIALKLMPGAPGPKNNLAAIYMENGQIEKAEKLLLEIV